MEAKNFPPRTVQSAEPTDVVEEDGYRVLTYEDVDVDIRISRTISPETPKIWVAGDRLDTQVETVTDVEFLGFELWRYTYLEGKPTHAGEGRHRGRFAEVEIEENHYGEDEVHEFSLRVKR